MNVKLRIVIVEDEPVIVRELEHLLLSIDPDIVVVARLGSVQESVAWFKAHADSYDLILMDIRLSDGRSFEIFHQVTISRPVIFVTSYDEYALEAFKSNGLDYILKPFDAADLQTALQKYRNWISTNPVEQPVDVQQLLASIRLVSPAYRKSFLLHVKDKLVPVEASQVAWFYTTEAAVFMQTLDNHRYVMDETMERLAQQLDPAQFFRANRQFIIQRKAVTEVDFYFNGRLHVHVSPPSPERVLISKARTPDFKRWMNS